MAKKTSKKPAPKPAKKSSSKPAAKPAKKAAKKASGGGEFKVNTGTGPSVAEIGGSLVALFNQGKFSDIENKWWSPKIESIEGFGTNTGWRGRGAVDGKNAWWLSMHTLHGASAEGPYLGSSGFAVKFRMDVEEKATGKRWTMDEVGVYTVQNGKIIREEFMYGEKPS
jgi:hypothetical protein